MQNKNNPEPEGFFDITLKKREDCESYEEQHQKQEQQKYNKIMRLARKHCPINYDKFAHLLKYKYNINYFGTKNLTNRYVEDLISVGKLTISKNRTITLGDAQK